MQSQFGWGVYAVCEYKAEERIGWYEGDEITAEQWGQLGKYEGREHTVRASWEDKHTARTVRCINPSGIPFPLRESDADWRH